jgi:hypothetical protein
MDFVSTARSFASPASSLAEEACEAGDAKMH